MSTAPLISVVIPAYNCQNYIVSALDSIFEQSYTNIEVIIVNDGSTDNTLQVLNNYRNPVTIINQDNSGSAVARSLGMKKSSGKYIAFLDADDLWLADKLKEQVEFLENHKDYGLVFSNWVTWKPNDKGEFVSTEISLNKSDIIVKKPYSGWIYSDLLMDCIVWTSCVLMRHSIYEQVGNFNTNLRRGQDYDYWLRVSKITQIHKLDRIYAVYRQHNESISNKVNSVNYEYIVIKSAIDNLGESSKNKKHVLQRLSDLCFDFSYQHYHNGSLKVALDSILKSIRYNPFKIKAWVYLILIASKYLYSSLFKNT